MEKFLWGCATSSAQIEGAYLTDGRTPSIWDNIDFKKVKNNDNCHIACDFFHHYKQDIKLAKSLGINSLRISLSWSRIIPSENKINSKGIKFYNDVINEMIKNNIEPMITIYHWDLPLWVHKLGGWENKKIINLFEFYCKVCANEFTDRVKYWFVFNEPQIFLTGGYYKGDTAPFHKNKYNFGETATNTLIAHKKGVDALRKFSKQKIKVGIAMSTSIFVPKENNKIEINKAYKKSFESSYGRKWNAFYSDPMILGKPVKYDKINRIKIKDIKNIKVKLDFIGINIYLPAVDRYYKKIRSDLTTTNWVVDERCIYYVCKYFYKRYKLPLMISENGFAVEDELKNGIINDNKRCRYLKYYLNELDKIKKEGIPIFGYLYWSLLDNFEWTSGYYPRFGLVYVDYRTLKRYKKKSFYFYSKYIKNSNY